MYEESYQKLIEAGYVSIGMDHYSKPDDEFAIALREKKLHRNFQGYCTRETTGQVYGFGASSISQLDSAYSQNIKTTSEYIQSIEKSGLAVLRGYSLNKNEKMKSKNRRIQITFLNPPHHGKGRSATSYED